MLCYNVMNSPVGRLTLIANNSALVAIFWQNDESNTRIRLAAASPNKKHRVLMETERQLAEYFNGQRRIFDLTMDPGGTEFQRKVWLALRRIPFGETTSYLHVAKAIGSPSASRAVGAAIGKNPLSIVVPCHRVIGSDGKLTGFAGGLETKAELLALESKNAPATAK